MGRKKITMCGLERAAAKVGGWGPLAMALALSAKTLKRWVKEDPDKALGRAIGKAGSQTALSKLLGVSQSAVSQWARYDAPPPVREPRNAVERAVQLAGGQPQLAKVLGVTQQNVSVWVRQGYVPANRAREIELQYGVPRADLLSPKIKSAAGLGGEL